MQVFRQLLGEGLTGAQDIAQEMGVTTGTVSKMAKKAIEPGWLKKNGREYELKCQDT
jgi:predicted transcriptional regulator